MLKFICHLDWNMGCPDTRINISLGVSVRMFPEEDSIGIVELRKADALSNVVGTLQSVEDLDGEGK